MRTIAHVYDSYSEASRVVEALEAHGIPHSDISIVSGDKSQQGTGTHSGMTSGDPEQGAETGAGTGASIGTVLGGGAGLLAGIGALAIPGVGPLVAAGWLVAAITGAGVGAAAGGLLGSLTGAGISEADAKTYDEGVQAGGTLVTVRVDEGMASDVERVMGMSAGTTGSTASTGMMGGTSSTGMMDNTATTGSTGYVAPAAAMGAATAGTMVTSTAGRTDDTIQVVKEDLAVGKREVEQGGVKVTSRVEETPVEQQVNLRQESVQVERRPVNQTVAGTDAFKNQTIEARATSEEAVVAKEARVVEEIGLRKEATDTTQTVRDTVRETKVDIDDTASKARVGTTGAMGGTPDGTPGNPPGTMASRAVDKTLDTNVSGANPGGTTSPTGGAPDGTPGNPPGTMASRAVDKTLDTNVSGANPGGKRS